MKKFVQLLFALALVFSMVAPSQVAQAQQSTLAPLGTDLGDVGQYYSNISPHMKSRVYIYNTSTSSTREVRIAIYSDKGVIANNINNRGYTLSCDISPNRVLYLLMNDLTATGNLVRQGGSGANCPATLPGFHGVHHMQIWQTTGGSELAVAVNAWHDTDRSQPKMAMGAYQAVPSWAVASSHVTPNVLVLRSSGWDTEVVDQNFSGGSVNVTFDWVMRNESTKYSNSVATLAANERRISLASQLLYAPSGGNLVKKNDWAWMKVRATGDIAVTTNLIKRLATDGKYRSEYGSEALMSFEQPRAGTELFVPAFVVDGTNTTLAIANAAGSTASLTMRLYNSAGNQAGNTVTDSVAVERMKLFQSNAFNAANGTYTLRISSSQNVTAAAWHKSGGGYTGSTAIKYEGGDGSVNFPFYWESYYGWADIVYATPTLNGDWMSDGVWYRDTGNYFGGGTQNPNRYAYLSFAHSGANDEMYSKLIAGATGPVARGKFENYSASNDKIVAYNGIVKPSDIWYVPFAPAPVTEFVWQTDVPVYQKPGGKYGVAGQVPPASNLAWAKALNWYQWTFLWKSGAWTEARNFCAGSATGDDRYMVMDKGLADYPSDAWGFTPDTQFNTTARMGAVRNIVPSACAGRPLLLANEPDHYSFQAFMTYPELGRQMFVHRQWPGDLYSPAFIHYSYNDLLSGGGYHSYGVNSPCRMDGPSVS